MDHPAPPAAVAGLAAERGLGRFDSTRKGDNPFVNLLSCLVLAGILFGAAALINWSLQWIPVKPLAYVALLCALAGVFVVGLGFYLLCQGFGAIYVYEHGVAWTRNGRRDAARWSDVDRLHVARDNKGKLSGAELVTLDGRAAALPARETDGADPVIDHLTHTVQAMGRPVVAGSLGDEAPVRAVRETGLSDQGVIRLAAIVGVLGSLVLGFTLYQLGFGVEVALVPTTLLALFLILLGWLVDYRLIRAGMAFFAITGLIALIVAVKLLEQVNGFVVGAVVLAVEGALVAAARAAYRRMPARRPTGRRRRLANRLGWQFQEQGTVPVGGPRTVARLIGVPTGATATTGDDVMHGVVHGRPVMVYDRRRRPSRIPDPLQTVWTVQLPVALPYVASSAFWSSHLATEFPGGQQPGFDDLVTAFLQGGRDTGPVEEHTTDPEVARVIVASTDRTVLNRIAGPWWIEGPYLYGLIGTGPPDAMRHQAESLVALAAALPWPALSRHAGT